MDFPAIHGVRGKALQVHLSSDNTDVAQGFSVWLKSNGDPLIDYRGQLEVFVVAFDPIDQASNVVPAVFLDGPFPATQAARAHYDLTPVTDNNPYFGMIRTRLGPVSSASSPYMDGGTEYFLNVQLLPFLSSDWLNLFLVATISVVFSLVFIFVPLVASRHGRARWPGMASYLIYFACLGAGFIIIELVFVQMFKKLIGYPTHTYATVIFSLLIAAGLGSLATKPLRIAETGRWRWVFVGILLLGLLFVITYQDLFHVFLAQPLALRVGVAVLMLFPLGFLMGMPLPLAINKLGQVAPQGIAWAWGMNGFFTVFGGFLSVILSFLLGFNVVLVTGLIIYALALFMYARMHSLHPA